MPAEDALRAGESRALSSGEAPLYTGSGKPAPKLKAKGKNKKRRTGFAAIIASLIIMGGGAAFLGTTNSLLPGAFPARMTEQTNTQYADAVERSRFLITRAMRGEAKLSEKSIKNLQSRKIEVQESGSGFKFIWNGQTIDENNFDSFYKSNVDFRDAYDDATNTKALGFFDEISIKIKNKFNVTGNALKDYKETSDPQENRNQYNETMESQYKSAETRSGFTTEETEVDDEGNKKTVLKMLDENSGTSKRDVATTEVSETAKTEARGFISKTAKAAAAANGACVTLRLGSMISAAVIGMEMLDSMLYAMNRAEPFSKMQVGEGSTSAINENLNFLTEKKKTTISDFSKVSPSNRESENALDTEVVKAPIEASSLGLILGGIATTAASTSNFSFNRISKSILSAFSLNPTTYDLCEGFQATQAVVSLALTGGIAKIVSTALLSTVIGVAISGAITVGLNFLIPTIAQVLYTNPAATIAGIAAGHFIAKGFYAMNSRIGRMGSGQAIASRSYALAYARTTNEVLALDAEVERSKLSPFDLSSKNTFLGSIAYSILPLTISNNSAISTLSSATTRSITKLSGNTYALSDTPSYSTTFGESELLDSIGGVGDLYGNPIIASDTSTIHLSKDDPTYKDVIEQNIETDENGKRSIRDNSNLAKYIQFNCNRLSPDGLFDADIAGALEAFGDKPLIATIVGAIPIIGDIVDVVNSLIHLTPENKAWVFGSSNVMSEENPNWDSEYKYYQRFVADERYEKQLGLEGGEQLVMAYLEKYEAEHPTDTSRAGALASISGLTKTDAETVLAIADYYHYLDEYHPESIPAIANTQPQSSIEIIATATAKNHPQFDNHSPVSHLGQNATIINKTAFTDLRNRSFAVC